MAVLTIVGVADTSALTLPANTWTSLIGGAKTVTGLGGIVTMMGYVDNTMDLTSLLLSFVVDGTDEIEAPGPVIMFNKALSIGTHTIDLKAFPFNNGQTANVRGCTAFTL